jgi:hypothetical protein
MGKPVLLPWPSPDFGDHDQRVATPPRLGIYRLENLSPQVGRHFLDIVVIDDRFRRIWPALWIKTSQFLG